MKILILPNSFKGSLSARQTTRVLSSCLKKHQIKSFPLSDGGDGFIDFFSALYPASQKIYLQAQDAFGQKKRTSYLWLKKQKTAIIETAQICGLGTAKKEDLSPLSASSYGVGETIGHALKKGAKKIYIGLGGVACNDGGYAIAAALGVRFLDKKANLLPLGAKPLLKLHSIELNNIQEKLKNTEIYAIADVTNPMLGPLGSARIFGPQKGASAADVRTLEKALSVYAEVVQKTTGKNIADTASTAAAGALCAGLYGLLNAKIILGSDFLQQHLPLKKWIHWADLVITAEGKLDQQTLFGKAPLAVLKEAAQQKKKVLFICGKYEESFLQQLPKKLNLSIICLSDFAQDLQDSIDNTAKYLKQAVKNI